MDPTSLNQFANLTFADFRRMAKDDRLSCHEKIGFPNFYRQGKEEAIFGDMVRKIPQLTHRQQIVLDIGPGCSGLARHIIDCCSAREHTLLLVDSQEMLDLLPDLDHLRKIPGRYPNCPELFTKYAGQVHAIIVYSVLHYVFAEGNVFDFLDRSLSLLAPGGAMLIGDIPNVCKRKRFFSSAAGVAHHRQFMGTEELPSVAFQQIEAGKIDDAVVCSLLMRARMAGFDAYVLPQAPDLPMANRREDMLISRP